MQKKNETKQTGVLFVLLCLCFSLSAQSARFSWRKYASKDDAWYRSDGGKKVAENILSFQDEYGSWPKNIDTAAEPFSGNRKDLQGMFDNGATTGEMRFLARAFRVTQEPRYEQAFIKALDLILKAQYPTGGWPQMYPPGRGYPRYITFNDEAMVRLMELLREIAKSSDYDFVDAARRTAAKKAFDDGVECILKCQIRVDGELKVWCAQHDEKDYTPRPARSYELASLSGGESAGILRLLMSLDDSTPEIIEAVSAGVNWYRGAAVKGIRVKWVDGERRAFEDADAGPLWGRFCEIETDRPFFCDRDGIPKYNYNEIDKERRNGYSWYGVWGQEVFREFEKWHQKWEHLLPPDGM